LTALFSVYIHNLFLLCQLIIARSAHGASCGLVIDASHNPCHAAATVQHASLASLSTGIRASHIHTNSADL